MQRVKALGDFDAATGTLTIKHQVDK